MLCSVNNTARVLYRWAGERHSCCALNLQNIHSMSVSLHILLFLLSYDLNYAEMQLLCSWKTQECLRFMLLSTSAPITFYGN